MLTSLKSGIMFSSLAGFWYNAIIVSRLIEADGEVHVWSSDRGAFTNRRFKWSIEKKSLDALKTEIRFGGCRLTACGMKGFVCMRKRTICFLVLLGFAALLS